MHANQFAAFHLSLFTIVMALAGCAQGQFGKDLRQEITGWPTPGPKPTHDFPTVATFPNWTDEDDTYRFYPGDVVDFQSIGAPELNRKLTIGPDGRLYPPMLGAIMVADRTPSDVTQELQDLYRAHLRNPLITLAPDTFASQKFFVGGEVAKPGLYELAGEMDPLQAIAIAGGFLTSARREEVVVLRRGAGGQPFMRVYDLKSVWSRTAFMAQLPRLRRFDVVWVPRSRVSELGLFTQQFVRDALPITLGFNYSLGTNFR
jgi:protein involved in polysaccharide export with SLBB domain